MDEETEGGEIERAWFPVAVCYALAFVVSWWMVLRLRDSQGDGAEKLFRVHWEYGWGLEYY